MTFLSIDCLDLYSLITSILGGNKIEWLEGVEDGYDDVSLEEMRDWRRKMVLLVKCMGYCLLYQL